VHYGGVEGDGSLVEAMPDSDRSHAIDWSVLDRIAVYDILEASGLEVYLVNARETKNPQLRN